jgi:uncharacterized protein DUF4259
MGTHGIGIFDNDDAWDWVHSFERAKSLAFVEGTLDTVIAAGSNYLEAPEACQALAAADVVARALGRPGQHAYELAAIDEWIERTRPAATQHLARKAVLAIERILAERSELRDLWEEGGASDDSREWRAIVADLKARLAA